MMSTATCVIVDKSALIACAFDDAESAELKRAILHGGFVPAPVLLEFRRVVTKCGSWPERFLTNLLGAELSVLPFGEAEAEIADAANYQFGLGNGRGGTLNLSDLMVYAAAKRRDLPLLCTGTDFSKTDIAIHPASRNW